MGDDSRKFSTRPVETRTREMPKAQTARSARATPKIQRRLRTAKAARASAIRSTAAPPAWRGRRFGGPASTRTAGISTRDSTVTATTPTQDQRPNSRTAETPLTITEAKPSTVVIPLTTIASPISSSTRATAARFASRSRAGWWWRSS